MGRIISNKTRQKMREAQLGKVLSDSTKEKIRQAHLGKSLTEAHKRKISKGNMGKAGSWLGKKMLPEHRKKLSLAKKGKVPTNFRSAQELAWKKNTGRTLSDEHKRKIGDAHRGEKSCNWIKDRTKLVKRQERNDSAYCAWRMEVYKRDIFKCRIADDDCKGRIIAHHILGWASYPKLRYEVNNGITLCQLHHPLKRKEESRLAPKFQELLIVKS